MKLLIDAGNTRIKLGWLAPGEHSRAHPPLMLDAGAITGLVRHIPGTPTRILGAIVAGPRVRAMLEQACRQAWGLAIEWCDSLAGRTLLHNGYTRPETLGADRWLGLLGLLRHVQDHPDWQAGAPCILASFGTATTVDTILMRPAPPGESQAAFIGGLILPGVTLMNRSLAQGTAQLPLADGPCAEFPTDTHAAIVSGIAAAQSGALLRQWRLALRAGGRAPLVYAAGGGWPAVRAEVARALELAQADHGLPAAPPAWLDGVVLDGLAALADRDTQPGSGPG